MALYWQKRKLQVAYNGLTKNILLKSLPSFDTYRKHRETHAKLQIAQRPTAAICKQE